MSIHSIGKSGTTENFCIKGMPNFQALLANITATDEIKNEINTFFTILSTKTAAKIMKNKKEFFSVFRIQILMTSVKSVT